MISKSSKVFRVSLKIGVIVCGSAYDFKRTYIDKCNFMVKLFSQITLYYIVYRISFANWKCLKLLVKLQSSRQLGINNFVQDSTLKSITENWNLMKTSLVEMQIFLFHVRTFSRLGIVSHHQKSSGTRFSIIVTRQWMYELPQELPSDFIRKLVDFKKLPKILEIPNWKFWYLC